MFEIGTGNGVALEGEGIKEAVVELEDNVQAWEALLKAMYHGR